MNMLRDHSLSFEEWGDTFKLSVDRHRDRAMYADKLLGDQRFSSILAEMEFNILSQIRMTRISDPEALQGLHVQLHAIKMLRKMLSMLASDVKLAGGEKE